MLEGASLGIYHIIKDVLIKCSTQTILFEIFLRGVNLQIEIKSRPDQEINVDVMKLLMNKMEVVLKGKV